MSEMVERVAQAIFPAFDHIADVEYRKVIAGCWARAAIEAMREPTNDVHKAMCAAYNSPASIWVAGIDAALKSPTDAD